MESRTRIWTGLGMVALMSVAAAAQRGAPAGQWSAHGGDAGSTKYAALDQINRENVSRLRIAWRRPAVDPSLGRDIPDFSYTHNFRSTPLMIDGVLYSSNAIGLVEAFNPA